MCDVIKIRLKRRDERKSGKGNPIKKDMDFDVIFMTSHMTLSSASDLCTYMHGEGVQFLKIKLNGQVIGKIFTENNNEY